MVNRPEGQLVRGRGKLDCVSLLPGCDPPNYNGYGEFRGFPPQIMKIIVGSGGHEMPGWKSTEIDEIDITKPLPFGDNEIEAIFASHVVEHISSPDAMRFFMESYRVLMPGGWLRLSVPIIGPHLTVEHILDLAMNHGHLCTYNPSLLKTLLYAAGFPNADFAEFDPDLDHHHKTIGEELDRLESCRIIAVK